MNWKIIQGDCRAVMAEMLEGSVQCVVTSPPYWGLRDYGIPATTWGPQMDADERGCRHAWENEQRISTGRNDQDRNRRNTDGRNPETQGLVGCPKQEASIGTFCAKCGAWRGSLGLEPTPELYVEHIVEVFQAVRRVLRKDGSAWLNLGDSYATASAGTKDGMWPVTYLNQTGGDKPGMTRAGRVPGLKPKDLVGIPWRVAFALQADGWWLRSDIIWAKPNPMPESVTDRPTRAHEYVFLLTKSARYFYDNLAIAEASRAPLRAITSGRTGSTSFSSSALGPKFNATLHTSDGTTDTWGWCDFGLSQIPVDGAVTWDAERLQIINGVGFKIGIKTPKGFYVVNLENTISSTTPNALKAITLQSRAALSWPVRPSITNTPPSPSGAVCTSHIQTDPLTGALTRAEVVSLECALVPGKWFAARITCQFEETSATFFVWDSLSTTHHGSFVPDPTNNIANSSQEVKRNKRSVWTIATQPFRGPHFATFPEALVEPCILAGASPKACGKCGAPWERVKKKVGECQVRWSETNLGPYRNRNKQDIYTTTGWQPTCKHDDDSGRCLVLDPFAGSGRVGLVCKRWGRDFVGIDLSEEYCQMARNRLKRTVIERFF